MSVEVKRAPEATLKPPELPFRDRSQTLPASVGRQASRPGRGRGAPGAPPSRLDAPSLQHNNNAPGKINRRRRYSERTDNRPHPFRRNSYSRRGREKIVLPTKFLLGGNITDPLNLNSLNDEDINKALNERTPVNSPLPTPIHRQQVHIVIPANIRDPLGLNSAGDDPNLISPKSSGKKKRKNKNKRKSSGGEEQQQLLEKIDPTKPVEIELPESDLSPEIEGVPVPFAALPAAPAAVAVATAAAAPAHKKARTDKILDKIVSPVIPQYSNQHQHWRKRKRTSSEGPESGSVPARQIFTEEQEKSDRVSPHRQIKKRHNSQPQEVPLPTETQVPPVVVPELPPKPSTSTKTSKKKDKRFVHGNYNRYYGYRNPAQERDVRLNIMRPEWFADKDVLDIGCNIGLMTLAIAKDYSPKKITGIDIDSNLIGIARKNTRYFISEHLADVKKYPKNMPSTYGPISAPILTKSDKPGFPENINFQQSNYVLDQDELLDLQHEEYDTILALSITKWLHLNNGDDGLKRCFRRMYRQLRPGGRLILEPQSWVSYKRRKKLTETIARNFEQIRLKPDQFTEYLLSREVGFSTCETLEVPKNKYKGFQRPIQVFVKSATAYPTPAYPAACSQCPTPVPALTDSCGNTPRFVFELDSRGCTPRFSTGSRTPGMSTVSSENSYGFITPATTPKADYADTSRVSTMSVTPATPATPVTPSKDDQSTSTSATPESYALRRTVSAPAFLQSLSGMLDASFASIEMEYDDLDRKALAPLKIPRKRADSLSLQAAEAAKKDNSVTNTSITIANDPAKSWEVENQDELRTTSIDGSTSSTNVSEAMEVSVETDVTKKETKRDSETLSNNQALSAKIETDNSYPSDALSILKLPKCDSESQAAITTATISDSDSASAGIQDREQNRDGSTLQKDSLNENSDSKDVKDIEGSKDEQISDSCENRDSTETSMQEQ